MKAVGGLTPVRLVRVARVTWDDARRITRSGLSRRAALTLGLASTAGLLAGCSDDGPDVPFVGGDDRSTGATPADALEWPVVAPGRPAESATAASAALATSSPAAVVLSPDASADEVTAATKAAEAAGVPCLVDGEGLGAELDRLGVEDVQLFGGSGATDDASSSSSGSTASWTEAVTSRSEVDSLPDVAREDPPRLVIVTPDTTKHAAAVATVVATLGRHDKTQVVEAEDPRADEVVEILRSDEDTRLVVVGDGRQLAGDAVAASARMAADAELLPTGGLLPLAGDRRMIALYGHPGVAGLGLLGEQDVDASVERVKGYVEDYAAAGDDTFLPAFEVIATIADSAAGDDGDYSTEGEPELYRPWVDAAKEAGVYVVLDLQPGRADFLSQAKLYEELLLEPHVGLALDPEWRLERDQLPLQQIGHVGIDEVNEVAEWLAELTREHDLPQKVFLLHQFQVQMLRDRDRLRTDLPELVTVIHADGHGTPDLKQETWRAILEDLPEGVEMGWKNFIDEDTPTFTPRRTLTEVDPVPRFVSYQ